MKLQLNIYRSMISIVNCNISNVSNTGQMKVGNPTPMATRGSCFRLFLHLEDHPYICEVLPIHMPPIARPNIYDPAHSTQLPLARFVFEHVGAALEPWGPPRGTLPPVTKVVDHLYLSDLISPISLEKVRSVNSWKRSIQSRNRICQIRNYLQCLLKPNRFDLACVPALCRLLMVWRL